MFRSKTLEKLLGKIGGGFISQDNLGNDLTESLTLKRNPANIIRTFDLTVTVDGHVLTYDQAAQSLALKPVPGGGSGVIATLTTPALDVLAAPGTFVEIAVPVGQTVWPISCGVYDTGGADGTLAGGPTLNFGTDLAPTVYAQTITAISQVNHRFNNIFPATIAGVQSPRTLRGSIQATATAGTATTYPVFFSFDIAIRIP